jgi:hypothetical protein
MPKPPPLILDQNSPAFSSADAAAHAYSSNMGKKGDTGEKAGVILKDPEGKYRYSTTLDGTNDNFELHAAIPKGYTFAGIMHSHPGNDARGQVFSPDDIHTSTNLKVPSYISFLESGEVRKYVPGQTKTQQIADPTSRMPLNVAKGDDLDIEAGH